MAHNREFRTWMGTLKGEPVSVVSTGVGSPGAAIAVVELLRLGVHTLVRVGSCGALQKSVSDGDLIVVTGACATKARRGNHPAVNIRQWLTRK